MYYMKKLSKSLYIFLHIIKCKTWKFTNNWKIECGFFSLPHWRLDCHIMFSDFWTIDGTPGHNIHTMNPTNANAKHNQKWHKLHFLATELFTVSILTNPLRSHLFIPFFFLVRYIFQNKFFLSIIMIYCFDW